MGRIRAFKIPKQVLKRLGFFDFFLDIIWPIIFIICIFTALILGKPSYMLYFLLYLFSWPDIRFRTFYYDGYLEDYDKRKKRFNWGAWKKAPTGIKTYNIWLDTKKLNKPKRKKLKRKNDI
jgi:hypothetical protein